MRFVVVLVLLAALPGAGAAQEASRPPPGAAREVARPLEVTVTPSGVESPEDEARRHQERLEARMRRNDFLFRSICRTCSPSDKFDSSAPFNPQEALRGQP
jgi:hypothetical protein